MDLASLWDWAGVSFGKQETFILFLSIKSLVEKRQLKSVRLWGKIQGIKNNYIIAEGELQDGVNDEEDIAANAVPFIAIDVDEIVKKPELGDEVLKNEKEVSPESKLAPKAKKFAPLSKESRIGANKYIYYVCKYIGGPWTRLPDVLPERLQESRKIRKYMTGELDTKV
jgi:radial spoke head protein 4A